MAGDPLPAAPPPPPTTFLPPARCPPPIPNPWSQLFVHHSHVCLGVCISPGGGSVKSRYPQPIGLARVGSWGAPAPAAPLPSPCLLTACTPMASPQLSAQKAIGQVSCSLPCLKKEGRKEEEEKEEGRVVIRGLLRCLISVSSAQLAGCVQVRAAAAGGLLLLQSRR